MSKLSKLSKHGDEWCRPKIPGNKKYLRLMNLQVSNGKVRRTKQEAVVKRGKDPAA